MNRHEYKKSAEEKKGPEQKTWFSVTSVLGSIYLFALLSLSHLMLPRCLHVMFVNYLFRVPYNCHACNCCLVDNNSCKTFGQPLNQILHYLVSVFHYFLVQKLTLHRYWGLYPNYFPGCFKFRLLLVQSQSCIALRLVSIEDLIEGLKKIFTLPVSHCSYKNVTFNPFRSYIGPRPTVWFSSSAPMSEDVWHGFCCLFARCRSLSDTFPYVVRTLVNR
jgi:hypothetical protein